MRSVPVMLLWSYISTSEGLEQWFADKVERDGRKFVFFWNNAPCEAVQISVRTGRTVRFRWSGTVDKSYFEMKIMVSELTDDTILSVTDYSEHDEVEDSKELWNKQIERLQRALGC